MSKVIISQFDFKEEHVPKNFWGIHHTVMVIHEEDLQTYLDYIASTEGYSSVRDYLKHNPLWKYSLDGGAKVAL